MASFDVIQMVGNISQSLFSVQKMMTGLGYLLGIFFIVKALNKFKEVAESRAGGGGAHLAEPFIYLLSGSILLYLPSAVRAFSSTLFGSDNILQYSKYNPYDIYSSIQVVVATAGVIWFIRGCVLMTHSSHSHGQKGSKSPAMKGLAFVIAGILAVNFKATMGMLDYTMTGLIHWVWH